MNTKNRLINRLLRIAKKHKVLTYPVLALVAIISAFSYFFNWTTGAGKRIVAVVMVMVMLVSQSYFLTSSATALVDDEKAVSTQSELQKQNEDLVVTEESKSNEERSTQVENTSEENSQPGEDVSNTSDNTVENTEDEQDKEENTVETDRSSEIADSGNTSDGESVTDAVGNESIAVDVNDKTSDTVDMKDANVEAADPVNVVEYNEVQYVVAFSYANTTGNRLMIARGTVQSNEVKNDKWGTSQYTYDMSSVIAANQGTWNATASSSDNTKDGCYEISGLYYDATCTQPVEDAANKKMKVASDGVVRLYMKATLKKYLFTVSSEVDEGETFSYGYNSESKDTPHYVDVAEDGTATFTLTDVTRTGYTIKGGTVTGGGTVTKVEGTNDLQITLSAGNVPTRTINLEWTGNTYYIEFAKYEYGSATTGQNDMQTVIYGSDAKLNSVKNIAIAQKAGFVFDCWQIGSDTAARIPDGASIKPYQLKLYSTGTETDPHVVLYPVYKYVGFELVGGDTSDQSVAFQYKTAADAVELKAQYKYDADRQQDGNFTYTIDETSLNALQAVGVTVSKTDGTNGKLTISVPSDGPTKVTSGAIELKFTVTDTNNTDPNSNSQTFTYKVSVEPKQLYITIPEKQKKKTYDKSTDASQVTSPLDTVDVNGKVTAAKVYFTATPQYNDANVATAKSITIADADIRFSNGEDPNNYILNSKEITGCSIEKRLVFVKTATSVLSVRTGEETPTNNFTVTLDEDVNSQGTMGLCPGDTIATLGTVTFTTNRPDDLTETGSYEITARTSDDANYKIDYREGAKATFDVIQDKPVLGKNYTIQAQQGEDGWYTGENGKVVTIAGSGYDSVYISADGVNFEPGGALKEAYSDNPDLKIQLKNSKTGAITSIGDLSIKYDITKPQYVGYKVEELEYESGQVPILPDGKALYFPGKGGAFDFGTYVNATVTIQVQYESDTSGLNELQYGLFGEEVGTRTTKFNTTTGIATIKVLKDSIKDADSKAGVIRCRAVDRAGNISDTIVLKPTKDSNDSYEWSVETVGPSMEPLTIYSGADKNVLVIDQSGKSDKDMAYYNHCQGRLVVTDSVSGINSITWHINGSNEEESVGDVSKKVTSKIFTKDMTAANTDDPYTVYATVRDNAGNEVDTNPVTFKLDDVAPELVVDYDEHVWSKETTISFTTSDALSGIYYARVTDADGNTIDCDLGSPTDGVYKASFQATKKGQYSIEVSDKAGNITSWTKNITMISTEVPECPTVSFEPEEADGENGWYITKPTAVLHTVLNTTDGTPVESEYSIWKDGESSYNRTPIAKEDENVVVEDDGYFHIQVWSESASGVTCADADSHITNVKVDTTAPDISFETEKGSGSNIIVKFAVTDKGSGVDKDSVKILHGSQNITASVEETEEGYAGSFEITETGNYSIQAADLAGNVADEAAFTPMSMKIKAITNITNSAATVGASIYKGTFDISSATIAYRKLADDAYTETDAVMNQDAKGNVSLSAVLSELTSATNYVYKITAVSEAGEVLEYEGHFQTLASDPRDGVSVVGTARYTTEKEGNITVGLYSGYSCIMAKEIEAGSEFVFEHVADGNYNVVATDGVYSKSIRVSIQDGMIEYPTQYIDLILSGKNTSIYVTTPDTPNISADNMDSIFADDLINFTEDDKALIDAGGTVEFQLCATLMTVSNVSAGEISAMYAVADKNKIVGAYLDMTLYKIVTETDGTTQKKKVTDLANGANISITIPLGELAGKPDLEVIRIHNDGENFIGASLSDQDNNVNTYTIVTNQFSTYAILYGTGVEPTTEVTTQQTTQKVDNNATNKPGVSNNKTSVTVTTEQKADQAKKNGKKNIKDNDKKPQASNTSSIGSLRSSGTAKTGDATPIVLLFGFMIAAFGCAGILRRQLKQK